MQRLTGITNRYGGEVISLSPCRFGTTVAVAPLLCALCVFLLNTLNRLGNYLARNFMCKFG
jgi:hypothetical protein